MAIRTRKKANTSFAMSSMTDIVFLLLIFFILLSTLVTPNALNVELPEASSQTTSKPPVTVVISAEGEFAVDDTKITREGLEGLLVEKVGALKSQGIKVVADKKAPYEYLVEVLDIANTHDFPIVLATKGKRK